MIHALHEALAAGDAGGAAIGEGWRVYKAADADAKGNALYVHVVADAAGRRRLPAVGGAGRTGARAAGRPAGEVPRRLRRRGDAAVADVRLARSGRQAARAPGRASSPKTLRLPLAVVRRRTLVPTTHRPRLLARSVREFAEREIRPHVREWDDAQHFPGRAAAGAGRSRADGHPDPRGLRRRRHVGGGLLHRARGAGAGRPVGVAVGGGAQRPGHRAHRACSGRRRRSSASSRRWRSGGSWRRGA